MKFRTILAAALASLVTAILVAQAQVPGVNSTLNSIFTLAYDQSTMKPTYSASNVFVPNTAAGTGTTTDVCVLAGSATKTIKVRRILFNLVATTAITDPIAVLKRSTANSGGTSVSLTPVPFDANSSAATAVFTVYTANPTVGTLVGVIADPMFSVGNLTTGGAQAFPSQILFGQLGSPIVLRGVAQSVAVNFNNYQYAANLASCTMEWTEDSDS